VIENLQIIKLTIKITTAL